MRLMHYRWLSGSAAVGLRSGLTMLLLFFGWWELLSQTASQDAVNAPSEKSQLANSPEKVDPVKQEYEALLIMDEDAMDEIDAWIRQAGEESLQQQDGSSITLPARIEQRLKPVKDAYEAFIQKYPRHVGVRLAFASFLTDRGDEMEARPHLIRATELDPQNAPAWNNLGNHYGHMGPVNKAFECYEMAITLNPEAAVYYHNFGTTVYLYRKDAREYYDIQEEEVFDKALALYGVAQKKEPKNFDLAEDIAQTYYGIRTREIPSKMARPEAALAAWNYALSIAPGDLEKQGVHLHLARVHLAMGQIDLASESLNQVLLPAYGELKGRIGKNIEKARQQLLPEASIR